MGCGGSKPADEDYDDIVVGNIPDCFFATGAALPQANGRFVREGNYGGAPLFKNGQFWLLRYGPLMSGATWWYIADKDQLDRDDGDLYRVNSPARLPPVSGWGLAKDGVAPAPTLTPYADRASAPAVGAQLGRPARREPTFGADGQELAANFEGEEIPGAYLLTGAAIPQANGVYTRDGTYSGAPLFKNGQLWLLRYTMPNGTRFWYVADKDQLDRDEGDLYRVKSPMGLPPQRGWGLAKDGVAPAPTLQALADEGPAGYFVHGAGCAAADGAYVRDGSYSSCPLYKQVDEGPFWLLRYSMPKGSHYWYVAHKDRLDSNDGDLYRVKSSAGTPPADGWALAKDGIAPAPSLSPWYPMPAGVAGASSDVPVGSAVPVVAQVVAQPVADPPMMGSAHMPVVEGVTVVTSWTTYGAPDGGWANAVPVAPLPALGAAVDAAAPATMSLKQKCELLGRELGLSGTVKEVVEGAAAELAVEVEGRALLAVADSCLQALGLVS